MSTLTEQEAVANLREAREVLAGLVSKRADHEKHLAELGKERASIAFAAHQGDKAARSRLDRIHSEHAKADSEFLSLDAAVSEAQSRVTDAERALAKAQKAGKAQEILALLPSLRRAGASLDEATQQVLAQYATVQSIIRQIRILSDAQYDDASLRRDSSPVPSEPLLRVACRRSFIASLVGTDLELERLAPHERHSGADLANGWAERAHGWAHRFVDQ